MIDYTGINRYLNQYPPTVSVLHPSALRCWEDHFTFEIEEIANCLCVFARQPKSLFLYWPPIGTVTPTVIARVNAMMNAVNPNTARIENIAETQHAFYAAQGLSLYKKADEYLYRRLDIVEYRGNRYKSQRHEVNHLLLHHHLVVRHFHEGDAAICAAIFNQWALRKSAVHANDPIALDMIITNRRAHHVACSEATALGLTGIIVEADGMPAAYSLGYPLNPATFVVLLEVCLPAYQGLSAFTFQQMCQQPQWAGYEHVNAMDDFGLENVRRTKHGYHPVKISAVYNAKGPYDFN